MVNTLTGKRCQRSVYYQVYIATKQFLQVFIHAEELQADRLRVVEDNEDVYIGTFVLLTPGIRTKQPCLQDGLRLEIVGYQSCDVLSCHISRFNIRLQRYELFSYTPNKL